MPLKTMLLDPNNLDWVELFKKYIGEGKEQMNTYEYNCTCKSCSVHGEVSAISISNAMNAIVDLKKNSYSGPDKITGTRIKTDKEGEIFTQSGKYNIIVRLKEEEKEQTMNVYEIVDPNGRIVTTADAETLADATQKLAGWAGKSNVKSIEFNGETNKVYTYGAVYVVRPQKPRISSEQIYQTEQLMNIVQGNIQHAVNAMGDITATVQKWPDFRNQKFSDYLENLEEDLTEIIPQLINTISDVKEKN